MPGAVLSIACFFDCGLSAWQQVEIVAFSDEEGVRFQSTFLGSKVIAGTLPISALNVTDAAGITLAEVRTAGALYCALAF